jgi:hypothetical protein
MSPGPNHEDFKELLSEIVKVVCQEREIPYRSLGSTSWRRPEIKRGIEADACFYLDPVKLALVASARKRRSNDVADDPDPDLAIEVDVPPSLVNRPGINAKLGVAKVWRCDGESVVIVQLAEDGRCTPSDRSELVSADPGRGSRSLGSTGKPGRRGELVAATPGLGSGGD